MAWLHWVIFSSCVVCLVAEECDARGHALESRLQAGEARLSELERAASYLRQELGDVRMAVAELSSNRRDPSLKASEDQTVVKAESSKTKLRPADVLRRMEVFNSWELTPDGTNETVSLMNGNEVIVAKGTAEHAAVGVAAKFDVLQQLLSADEVRTIRGLLKRSSDDGVRFDSDPDTVDGMATHEIFVESPDMTNGGLKLDSDPTHFRSRAPLRSELKAVMDPIVQQRLVPFLQHRFPACKRAACVPCYSLIRRYRPDERMSHSTHYDAHALVTVVISLSDYGRDYTGGIYVATGFHTGRSRIVALRKGDAVAHQSDLLHGVNVDRGHRWSWILWFRDTDRCDSSTEAEWFRDCAHRGNAVCQYLYATKAHTRPELQLDQHAAEILKWNKLAAEQGFGPALIKIARAYLKLLPSSLERDTAKAAALFRQATETSGEPDGHYALVQMILDNEEIGSLSDVVRQLELAAMGGHAFAMFNLGIAHLYGYSFDRDPDVAAEWFLACGLPEGLAAVAMHRNAAGLTKEAGGFQERAQRLGFGAPWRRRAREATGSGGSSGVDINLPWPPLQNGVRPQAF